MRSLVYGGSLYYGGGVAHGVCREMEFNRSHGGTTGRIPFDLESGVAGRKLYEGMQHGCGMYDR